MAGIYDTCAECGVSMTHPAGRGKARKYCSDECQVKAAAKREAVRNLAQCCVDGCDKPATRVGAKMCERHYVRQHRNGTTKYVGNVIPGNRKHSGGYVLQAAPGHPRALGGYRAYQHRVVFTDKHGEGPFNCHWCDAVVTWSDMHVDHVDSDPTNNAIENLVASCADCNQRRGHEKIRATMRARYGITIDGETRTLNEWAAKAGISRSSIVARLKAGWEPKRAVFEPRGKFGPKSRPTTSACCLSVDGGQHLDSFCLGTDRFSLCAHPRNGEIF